MSDIRPVIRLLRPKQWIKNAFVFAPLFFSTRYTDWGSWIVTIEAALCFLCVSCAVYITNDLHDMQEDRLHPVKKHRPLASGAVQPYFAALIACGFAATSLFVMTVLPSGCALIAVFYLLLNLSYTLYLKKLALIDVFFIAFCYVLRVLMGCYALGVTVSPWIILATFLLALFLGFGKRYNELGIAEYASAKANLQHYSRPLLDRLVTICGSGALMAYAIYAAEIAERTGKVGMVYTVGFVAFGLFRYLQSIYVYNQGGEPEVIIMKDRLQLANVLAWLVVTMWVLV